MSDVEAAPTYRKDGDAWTKVTFEELRPGDIIKIYESTKKDKLRGACLWEVTSNPYYVEDEEAMGVEALPIDEDSHLMKEANNE